MTTTTHNNSHPIGIREVLQQLMQLKHIKSGTQLAKQLDIPAPTVNRLLSGQVHDPRASTLSLISNFFGVSIDQLLGKQSLPESLTQGQAQPVQPSMIVPMISSALTTNIQTTLNQVQDYFRWASDTPSEHLNVFAMRIDHSRFEPVFMQGTLLMIDPDLKPQEHDYVAVQFEDDEFVAIRKLASDGRELYFNPIIAGQKTLAASDIQHEILGVVIEAHMDLTKLR